MRKTTTVIVLAAALSVAGLSSCAKPDATPDSATTSSAKQNTETPSGKGLGTATNNGFAGGSTETPPPQVDANKASATELRDAMKAGGVKDPDKWLKVIEENRPYDPAADTFYKKLRAELKKAGADDETQDRIVSVLQK